MTQSEAPLKEYIGFIWIGDDPGIRLRLMARDAKHAEELVIAEYGDGHPFSVWNDVDEHKPR
ncbi:MAG: hypothetical protein AAGC53_22860 [Actinomycetota bacterium]